MRYLKNPNAWSCLPAAFAMVLDVDLEYFINLIGHDGSACPYEELPEARAGFHVQECIEVVQNLGYACTPIEYVPQQYPQPGGPIRQIWFSGDEGEISGNLARLKKHMRNSDGIFTGVKIRQDEVIGHAVAWDHVLRYIQDPRGKVCCPYIFEQCGLYNFMPQIFWKIQRIAPC